MSSITDRFEYRAPTDGQVQDISLIRTECKVLAGLLAQMPMEPRCRALALTNLEQVSMWANKGLVFVEETVTGAPLSEASRQSGRLSRDD